MFFPMYYDSTYLLAELLVIPAILFAMYAQFKVKGAFERYSRIPSRSGLTGAEVARRLLDRFGATDVTVGQATGFFGDHYDPRRKQLNLSANVYHSPSVAALGVAAHETGHALQHAQNYKALALRGALVPAAAGSNLGLLLGVVGYFWFHSPTLILAGIALFAGFVFFTLVTLPVEFNASSRALQLLQDGGYLAPDEIPHVRRVLGAAALTYVAAAAVALAHLLRLVFLFMGASRDD